MAKRSNQASTGSFPTMGTSASRSKAAPVTKNLKTVPKRGEAKGGALEAATAAHRPNIQERLGAKLHPTATLYAQNAAEASATQRNVRLLPSASGNRDFFLRRQYGQGL